MAKGIFDEEIIPIELRGKIIDKDDVIRPGVTAETLASLKPSFPEWGDATTTAGNAGAAGDGAALCILTTRERAEKEGMPILGKYVSCAVTGELLLCQEMKNIEACRNTSNRSGTSVHG